ncbi:MAG TPA: efflux RND transporter periplasmic adaptor subunit [Terriglobales bacterium]|nr:efflux RND transporter periplasmic adaptor subunit [Terriglobales bacterium]
MAIPTKFAFRTLALIAVACLTACSKEQAEPQPVVSVQAVPVKQGSISQTITTDAVLFPINQATIVPKIAAPVQKAFVVRGAKVRQGQLLVTLENKDLAAAAEQGRGDLAQAQAAEVIATNNSVPEELQKAQLDTQAAKENFDAQQKLYDSRKALFDQGAIPRKDLDAAAVAMVQAKAQYEQAHKHLAGLQSVGHEQEIKSAKAQLVSAEGKYKSAAAQFGYSEIRSPIDGVVTDGPWYPGMMPQAGAPLVTVMNLSQMVAKAHIPQNQAALLKKGDEATVTVAGADEPIKGKVTLVSPALDPGSTTVEVWVQAPNTKGILKAGASVSLSMVAKTVPNALVVPAQAVVTDEEGKKSLMVIGSDGVAHKRDVETGIQSADSVQIVNGVKPGEQIVSAGAYGLPDNTKVKIEAAPQPGNEGDQGKGKDTQGGSEP